MGIIISILLLGLVGGWIVNYLADVLPVARGISQPVCWNCKTKYSWMDYLFFRNCTNCGKPRLLRTYIVLVIVPALSIYIWFLKAHKLEFPLAFLLVVYLMLIATIDIEHRLILHMTSIVGAVIGLGLGIHLNGIVSTLLGGAVGFGAMLAFYYLGELFVRYMSKRRNETIDEVALGFGDVNLAGITGLLLGYPGVILGLLFAILAGGLISFLFVVVMLLRHQYKAFSAIPYGPFMILGILFLFFKP